MSDVWDEARIQQYITDGVEESLTLDYKAAGSLAKTDGKKAEITKDVSAMANSAGGIILYGVAEFQDQALKHLPERIDPIDRTQITKEWLEQVISNIRPKIDGVLIHPVTLNTAPIHAVYVVEIPQGSTAHQAADKRYYKRFNFESVAMEDYEIRDVMTRQKHPLIQLEFKIVKNQYQEAPSDPYTNLTMSYLSSRAATTPKIITEYTLEVWACNAGDIYAQYINAFVGIPVALLSKQDLEFQDRKTYDTDGVIYTDYYAENTERDVVDIEMVGLRSYPKYGPSRYAPLLPKRQQLLREIELDSELENINLEIYCLEWFVHADNASPVKGRIFLKDIEMVDKSK